MNKRAKIWQRPQRSPMTLDMLEMELKQARELGASGDEPVFLEGTVRTGINGLKISTITRAYHANLCNPVSLGVGPIISIWGVPDKEEEEEEGA